MLCLFAVDCFPFCLVCCLWSCCCVYVDFLLGGFDLFVLVLYWCCWGWVISRAWLVEICCLVAFSYLLALDCCRRHIKLG